MLLTPFDLDDPDALREVDALTRDRYLRALTLVHHYRAPWALAIAAVNDADEQTEAHDAPPA